MKTVYAALPIDICQEELENSHQTVCPFCGRLCYDTPLTLAVQEGGAEKACMICALEKGAGVWTGDGAGILSNEPTHGKRRMHV
ncbi:MAG: hypothetical protein ACYC2T_15745 [Bacillota bacterium]